MLIYSTLVRCSCQFDAHSTPLRRSVDAHSTLIRRQFNAQWTLFVGHTPRAAMRSSLLRHAALYTVTWCPSVARPCTFNTLPACAYEGALCCSTMSCDVTCHVMFLACFVRHTAALLLLSHAALYTSRSWRPWLQPRVARPHSTHCQRQPAVPHSPGRKLNEELLHLVQPGGGLLCMHCASRQDQVLARACPAGPRRAWPGIVPQVAIVQGHTVQRHWVRFRLRMRQVRLHNLKCWPEMCCTCHSPKAARLATHARCELHHSM